MAKSETLDNKGNSSDTLWAVYILQILKRHSSPKSKLSTKKVYEYLKTEYSVRTCENENSQIKKARRHLYTLHESYGKGCIRMEEGRTKSEGNLWWYDAARDELPGENVQVQETLSDIEIGVLVDLLAATKILNSEGTRGLIDKLLKKASIPDEERIRILDAIREEGWNKTRNTDLLEKQDFIKEYIDARVRGDDNIIVFDYENEKSIRAVPVGWDFVDGCRLVAIVEDQRCFFSLDKIRLHYGECGEGSDDPEDFRIYDKETDSDKTTLDSLFVNIPIIKNAISDNKCITFLYHSHRIQYGRVLPIPNEKSVLPCDLTFNDGKYYLIGIDVADAELKKNVYFRVDLMSELRDSEMQIELFGSKKYNFNAIERARVVDNHPLMVSGKDETITFKVVESAIDRAVDAFYVDLGQMRVTKETRAIKNAPNDEGFHDEVIVLIDVRTSEEEAFRWALANADAVEITTQRIRDKIARLSDPIYQLYTQTMPDKVRANFDYVLREGTFKISYLVDEETAYETYEELAKRGKLGVVDNVGVAGEDICELGDYFGDFINAERLYLFTPQLENVSWASRLVNLEKLELKEIQMDDISWMRNLKKLREVQILESTISDLSVLSDHEDIWHLDISGTEVGDISFIQNYQKLDYLNVVACPIKDYSPLLTMQSRLNCLEIDERALELIGEDKIRERHIGITIIPRPNTPFWRSLI